MLFDLPTILLASYIFSWQFPHFYGILYDNKDDYAKAGFVMISDEDPTGRNKAHKQMFACNVFNTLIPVAMAVPSVALIHPGVLAPFMIFQAKSFMALRQFYKEEGSKKSAKAVKRAAYAPFMVLLLGFSGTTMWKRYEKRREMDAELWSNRL